MATLSLCLNADSGGGRRSYSGGMAIRYVDGLPLERREGMSRLDGLLIADRTYSDEACEFDITSFVQVCTHAVS